MICNMIETCVVGPILIVDASILTTIYYLILHKEQLQLLLEIKNDNVKSNLQSRKLKVFRYETLC